MRKPVSFLDLNLIWISKNLVTRHGTMERLEQYFYWHGKTVARFPVFFIFFCISVTLTCGLGLLTFREEAEMTALWVPRYSPRFFSGLILATKDLLFI